VTNLYDFAVKASDGAEVSLEQYRGKVLLIVNTASACGFTPQYAELQHLQQTYGDRGFQVLAFPCNQFGKQEPGDAQTIHAFCELNYGVTFPVLAKVDVNGSGAEPLFEHLKQAAPGVLGTTRIKWNFTKFLVDRQGMVVKRYAPQTKPKGLTADIELLLGQ